MSEQNGRGLHQLLRFDCIPTSNKIHTNCVFYKHILRSLADFEQIKPKFSCRISKNGYNSCIDGGDMLVLFW